MRSNTKVTLDEQSIKQLTDVAFPNLSILAISELKEGWFNTAYKIEFTNLYTIVLKVGPPIHANILSYEKNMMEGEITCMELVNTSIDILAPKIIYNDVSRSVIDYPFFFMDYIKGKSWESLKAELTSDQTNLLMSQLGGIAKKINSISNPSNNGFGYFNSDHLHATWFKAFEAMLLQLFDDAKHYNIKLPISKQDFSNILIENQSIFEDVKQAKLLHWDLSPANVMIKKDSNDLYQITGVIDFERAIWGDPLMENILFDVNSSHEFYFSSYGEDLFHSNNQFKKRTFYNLYLLLVIIIEDGPRDYDNKEAVIWAKQELIKILNILNT